MPTTRRCRVDSSWQRPTAIVPAQFVHLSQVFVQLCTFSSPPTKGTSKGVSGSAHRGNDDRNNLPIRQMWLLFEFDGLPSNDTAKSIGWANHDCSTVSHRWRTINPHYH